MNKKIVTFFLQNKGLVLETWTVPPGLSERVSVGISSSQSCKEIFELIVNRENFDANKKKLNTQLKRHHFQNDKRDKEITQAHSPIC